MTHHTDERATLLKIERSLMGRSLDEWVMETGAVALNSSWHGELAAIVRMAFDKGVEVEQAARRAPAVPVPQGWKLVPVEPTENMYMCVGYYKDDPAIAKRVIRRDYQAMLAAAPQPPEADHIEQHLEMVADHIPDAGKMDANVRNWMNAALSKDVACPACGLSGLHACPSASTAESQGADAVKALEKVLRAVQRHLPPERIGERETIAEIISIVDPWPLGKPPVPWKDHMTAELVGKLTDVARQFHGTQQLRERIAGLVRPVCERIKQFDGDRMPEVDMGNPISAAAPVQLPEHVYTLRIRGRLHDHTPALPAFDLEDGEHKLYTEQQVRQLLAAHSIKEQST